MISKNNSLVGGKKIIPSVGSGTVRDSYVGDEGINWHSHSGELFGNLKFKCGHTLSPNNSIIYSKEIIKNHPNVTKHNPRYRNYMSIIP